MTLTLRIICCLTVATLGLVGLTQNPVPPPVVPTLPDKTRMLTLVVEHFWQTNCYILVGPHNKAIVIDPGDDLEMIDRDATGKKDLYQPNGKDAKRIYEAITKNKLKLEYIILSHGHLDHIGAVGYLKERTGAKILMHGADIRPEGDPFAGCPKDARMFKGGLPKVDQALKDGDIISLDGMTLQVMHTPGHSPGGICLLTHYQGKTVLFSGDTLLHYYLGIDGNYYDTGRTNFRDGSGDQELLYKNVREKLLTLPPDTIVYPGHYEPTIIADERKFSPAAKVPEAKPEEKKEP